MVVHTPATRLMLACLSEDLQQFDQLQRAGIQAADWQELVRLSQLHGVTPLIHKRLTNLSTSGNVPSVFLEQIRDIYLDNLKRNMRLFRELEQVLKSLAEEGIPVIPLKGAYLAEAIYRNIGLRPMVDIDLLLPLRDMAKALMILDDLGYRAKFPFDIKSEIGIQHHLPQLYRPRSVKLEIHWNLAPANTPFSIDIDQIWVRSLPSTIAGQPVRAMHPGDLILYLCLHAAYLDSFTSRLRPFCDIGWVLQFYKNDLEWEWIAKQAEAWRASRSVWLGLKLSQRLLEVSLPQAVLENLQPVNYDPIVEEWACEQILDPTEIGPKLAAAWAPQPVVSRLRQVLRSIFPPAWEMRQKYPGLARGLRWPTAYLKHFRVTFKQNSQTLWRLMQGDKQVREAIEQRSRVNMLAAWQAGETIQN